MINALRKQSPPATVTDMPKITQLNVSEKGEKLMQNCFRDVYKNIVNQRLMENVHYVQTMKKREYLSTVPWGNEGSRLWSRRTRRHRVTQADLLIENFVSPIRTHVSMMRPDVSPD